MYFQVKRNKVDNLDIERNTANYIMAGAGSSNNTENAPSTIKNANGKTENEVLVLTDQTLLHNSKIGKGKIKENENAKKQQSNSLGSKNKKYMGRDKADFPEPILRSLPPDLQAIVDSQYVNLKSNDVSTGNRKGSKTKNTSSQFVTSCTNNSPSVAKKVENGLNNTFNRFKEPIDKTRLKTVSAITSKYRVKKPSLTKSQTIQIKSKPKLRRRRFRRGKVTSTSSVGTQSDISSFANIDLMDNFRGASQPQSILWNETLPRFISDVPGTREGHDNDDDDITVVTNKTVSTPTRRKIKHKRSVAKTHWTKSKF